MSGLQTTLLTVLGLFAGACIIVQQALVAELRTAFSSALWAVFVSYLGGLATMALVLAVARHPLPSLAQGSSAGWWCWFGGVFGVLYIATAIAILPRLGAATTFALILAGQMAASLAIDHFGLFGVPEHAMTWSRLAGALLLAGGVLLISR